MPDVNSLPKVTVILGAGANVAIEGFGGGNQNPVWAPPLARDLFGPRLGTNDWKKVIGEYPGALDIALRLDYDIRRNSSRILEAYLEDYANHDDDQTRINFRFIAPYLRDLLWSVSRLYLGSESPRTLHRLVSKLMADSPRHHVAFVNYVMDNFIEIFYTAQHDSIATSLSNVSAANLRPSTCVR